MKKALYLLLLGSLVFQADQAFAQNDVQPRPATVLEEKPQHKQARSAISWATEWDYFRAVDKIEHTANQTIVHFRLEYAPDETFSFYFGGVGSDIAWTLRDDATGQFFAAKSIRNVRKNGLLVTQEIAPNSKEYYTASENAVYTCEIVFDRLPASVQRVDLIEGKEYVDVTYNFHVYNLPVQSTPIAQTQPILELVEKAPAKVEDAEADYVEFDQLSLEDLDVTESGVEWTPATNTTWSRCQVPSIKRSGKQVILEFQYHDEDGYLTIHGPKGDHPWELREMDGGRIIKSSAVRNLRFNGEMLDRNLRKQMDMEGKRGEGVYSCEIVFDNVPDDFYQANLIEGTETEAAKRQWHFNVFGMFIPVDIADEKPYKPSRKQTRPAMAWATEWGYFRAVDKIEHTETQTIVHFRLEHAPDQTFGFILGGAGSEIAWTLRDDATGQFFAAKSIRNVRENGVVLTPEIAANTDENYFGQENAVYTCEIVFDRLPASVRRVDLIEGKEYADVTYNFHVYNLPIRFERNAQPQPAEPVVAEETNETNPSAVAVVGQAEASLYQIFPNPSPEGQFQLKNLGESARVDVQVIDLSGKVLFQQRIQLEGGSAQAIQPQTLPAGQYLVRIQNGDKLVSLPLVVVNP